MVISSAIILTNCRLNRKSFLSENNTRNVTYNVRCMQWTLVNRLFDYYYQYNFQTSEYCQKQRANERKKKKTKTKTKIPILKYRISVNCFDFIHRISFLYVRIASFVCNWRIFVPNFIGKSVYDKLLFNSIDFYFIYYWKQRIREKSPYDANEVKRHLDLNAERTLMTTTTTTTETCTKTLNETVSQSVRKKKKQKKNEGKLNAEFEWIRRKMHLCSMHTVSQWNT